MEQVQRSWSNRNLPAPALLAISAFLAISPAATAAPLTILSAISATQQDVPSQPDPNNKINPLTQIEQVTTLTNAQAAKGLPVTIQATVTYARPSEQNLFISDKGHGLYALFPTEMGLLAGDRIEITGITAPSFRPILYAKSVRLLAHGKVPPPLPASYADLIQSRFDSQFIQIKGRVLAATKDGVEADATLRLKVAVTGGTLGAIIAHPGSLVPKDLLDAEVQLTGAAGGDFDSRMQMAGVFLSIFSSDNVTILHPHTVDPWNDPILPTPQVVFAYRDNSNSKRVHIAGTLTYFEPGYLAIIEREGKGMLVETGYRLPLHTGMSVEATGFPAIAGSVLLKDSILRQVPGQSTAAPQPIEWEDAAAGHYAYNLVSMEGEVVGVVRDARVDLLEILSHGHLFSASVRRSSSEATPDTEALPMPETGSRVRITGACFVAQGDHWKDRLWFDIRMRSLNDVLVLQKPSWWTVKHLAYLISFLSLAVLAAVLYVLRLERRLRAQSAIISKQSQEDAQRERRIGQQEQQRSQILEQISSASSLPVILREIQSLVSTRLDGAPCWFELEGNESDNPQPPVPNSPPPITQQMLSSDGTSLGTLKVLLKATQTASLPKFDNTATDVASALLIGSRLAALAIDTRRLYSDLRHRSEYDLLTDIPNRFSMEKHLDELMSESQELGTIFGLIYVDLDRFKQVNDRYGHRTGDLFLQEVTRRMKLQLRNGDMLARIGGDEFIALVPALHTRANAEEVAARLEKSFMEPIEVDGYRLQASASLGLAIYPDDGSNPEDLQRVADEAMYANKEAKRNLERRHETYQITKPQNALR